MRDSEPMLEIESLWKLYKLPRAAASLSSLPYPHAAGSPDKDDALVQKGRAFWALRNINLSIQKGEVVGLIGANGAGKSTLLKILSRVTPPTRGAVRIHGSIVSLLEVGTGFHDELTGRENVRLNATMLGMRPEEIDRTYDQIVEFSGLGHFVDLPVKHLSSGMRVRLGFSVAVHVDPDILIIDEVLSVGDAEFRQRCRRRINELMGARDRTVIVVSHSMADLDALCSRVVLLEGGTIAIDGSPDTAIQKYLGRIKSDASIQLEDSLKPEAEQPPDIPSAPEKCVPTLDRENRWQLRNRTDFTGSGLLRFDTLSFCNAKGERVSQVAPLDALTVRLTYTANSDIVGRRPCAANISFTADSGERLFWLPSRFLTDGRANIAEQGEFVWTIPEVPLLRGTYMIDAWCNIDGVMAFKLKWAATLKVSAGPKRYQKTRHGHVLVKYDWSDGTDEPSED